MSSWRWGLAAVLCAVLLTNCGVTSNPNPGIPKSPVDSKSTNTEGKTTLPEGGNGNPPVENQMTPPLLEEEEDPTLHIPFYSDTYREGGKTTLPNITLINSQIGGAESESQVTPSHQEEDDEEHHDDEEEGEASPPSVPRVPNSPPQPRTPRPTLLTGGTQRPASFPAPTSGSRGAAGGPRTTSTPRSPSGAKPTNNSTRRARKRHVHHDKWEEFGPYFMVTSFIVITGLTKIVFHHARFLLSHFPESCLLIVAGAGVGAVMYKLGALGAESVEHPSAAGNFFYSGVLAGGTTTAPSPPKWALLPEFTTTLFFAILLPPIILESAYSLYDRQFATNISNVLLYAVVGTIYNTFFMGCLMYMVSYLGGLGSLLASLKGEGAEDFDLTLADCFVFGAVAAAVDPVAVLAIFQQIGVNKDLYFLLFGESLLNDAVTVALYSSTVAFTKHIGNGEIAQSSEYGEAVGLLLAAGFGGAGLGALGGVLTAFVTRLTRDTRVVEPLAVLGIAYLSYITAEIFHVSGIISIISCGLLQSHYSFRNISQESHTTVKHFTKMISCTADSAIFLYIGAELVAEDYAWHAPFVLWALLLCLVCRFSGVFLLTAASNALGTGPEVGWRHQVVLGYGGLRGATCYALARMLDPEYPPSELFATASLAIVLFTVFLQGGTIKYLVSLLKIEKLSTSQKTLNQEVCEHVSTLVLAGVEEIARARGENYIKRKIEAFDNKYLKAIFVNPDAPTDLKRLYEELSLIDHLSKLYTRKLLQQPVHLAERVAEEGQADALFMRTFMGLSMAAPQHEQQQTAEQPLSPPPPGAEPERGGVRSASSILVLSSEPREETPTLMPAQQQQQQEQQQAQQEPPSAVVLHEAMQTSPYNQFQYRHERVTGPGVSHELRARVQVLRRAVLALAHNSSTAGTSVLLNSSRAPRDFHPHQQH